MNVVDSSGWLEFLADNPNADAFAEPILKPEILLVPVVSIYEVFKKVLLERDETTALQVVALMMQGRLVDLDADLALSAAKLSIAQRLPMADSLILSTARKYGATLWTQDEDFAGMEGVRYFPKAAAE
ncbi:MAG TPA: type II toxin-antitoxin system VapC family toxin [Thermoanaerobaculia bacterium]|nr:type II toxin-antitoxin system VapC family toxin [Thermoanaerobaculia bacterium]